MFWSLSYQLLPGEDVIEDSSARTHPGIKPAYSIFLTTKRAIFRFDGIGSFLAQSFFYDEMLDIKPVKRLFVDYLLVKTKKREYFLNVPEADYWAKKIAGIRDGQKPEAKSVSHHTAKGEKKELLTMLMTLRRKGVLTEKEFDEKVSLLDTLKF